jgi:hypothetical protein
VAHGGLVSVALPARAAGLEWRLARPFDGKIVREVGEADVYALTKGETPKAYKAIEYKVVVR